jgi:hypothetical protein
LFNTPPTILLKGVLYALTLEHKVIFAGNPVSYSDERKLAPLFQRHGNALVFSPLTPAVVYEKSLKPIFTDTPLADAAAMISSHILTIYKFLCDCSITDILISPRELQMMALLIRTYHYRHPSIDPVTITSNIIYQQAIHLVPKDKRLEFDRLFKPVSPLPLESVPKTPGFLITESRHSIMQQINERLMLRELRREMPGTEAQQYGGLGGIILEGDPGVGKSELVIASLMARGYHEIHDFSAPVTHEKPFYRMPVSMPLDAKEALLRKAFDLGAVVVIDEINSSPMMERLLNDLLMGKTPENKRPTSPGFMVIGTQNPISMAGRRVTSNALARRFTTLELASYTHQELHAILIESGVPATETLTMVNIFTKQVAFAKQNHLTPVPTLRDLLKLADAVITLRREAREALMSAGVERVVESPVTTVQSSSGFWSNPVTTGVEAGAGATRVP